MAEIKKKFYEKLENFGPTKQNSITVSRADYDLMMHRILQLQEDKAIRKDE